MRGLECVVCGAELVPAEDPPHCVDCYVGEEDRARWENAMSEARSEHEFEFDGTTARGRPAKYRVGFAPRSRLWFLQRLDPSLDRSAPVWRDMGCDYDFAAAEIARLRGLVPPGGEEEK